MPAATHAAHVKGLRELVAAFDLMQGKTSSEVRVALAEAGEPVKDAAESLAVANVRNIGEDWSRMRLGITRSLVYIAPAMRSRRTGLRRPNLAILLLERAMFPAVERNEAGVIRALDAMLGRLAGEGGFH